MADSGCSAATLGFVAITAGNYDAPDQWRPPRRYFATCCFLHCVADDTDHCVANEVRAFTHQINASTSASGRQVKANHDSSIANPAMVGLKISLRPSQVAQLLDSLGAL